MTIKFQCIDEQHAELATLSMQRMGRKVVRLGRAVVCDGEWTYRVVEVAHENMSHSLTPTEYDIQALRDAQ